MHFPCELYVHVTGWFPSWNCLVAAHQNELPHSNIVQRRQGWQRVGRRHLQSYIDNWPLAIIDIYTNYLTQGKTCDLIIYFLLPAFSLTSIFGWRQSMTVTKHPYSYTNQKTSSLRCEYWKLTMIDNNIPLLKSTMALCSTSLSGTTG